MAERKSISKKVRFEIFKRDSFTCQYCGRSAPDAVLEVDHIIAVANGGNNEITNLITSCFDCNRGKKHRKLTDSQAIKVQKKELDKLNKRKEQLEMMAKWQMELIDIEKQEAEKIIYVINAKYDLNISCSDNNIKEFSKIIKKYGFSESLESSLLAIEKNGEEVTFKNISNICHTRKIDKEKPYLKDLYYIRAIMRNRFSYINEYQAISLMEQAYRAGVSIDELTKKAKEFSNWYDWEEEIEIDIGYYEANKEGPEI
jgi:hypothetical protein